MLKKLLLSESYSDHAFETQLNKINIEKSKIFTLVILILELIMLMLTYVVPEVFDVELLTKYRLHYITLGLYALIFYSLSIVFLDKNIYDKPIIKYIINFTVLFGLFWGISITLMDLKGTGTISVYLTFLFILSIVITARPDITMLIFTATQIVFIMCLPDAERIGALMINSTIFIVFAWFVTRQQYEKAYKKFKREGVIAEKNEVLEKQNVELVRLTMMDHLTGLYNRYSLDDVLSKKWLEAYIHKVNITVLMMDVDYFKKYNDTYGHMKGDECLVRIAEVLKEVATDFDGFPFRYGGDEFCLIFSELAYLETVVEAINKKISQMGISIEGQHIPVTLSIGIFSDVPKQCDNEWQCIELADQDLYTIKSKRNRRVSD